MTETATPPKIQQATGPEQHKGIHVYGIVPRRHRADN
jgi:hypothetical protein